MAAKHNPPKYFAHCDKEEHKRISSMGGKASAEAQRAKRNMKDTLDLLLSMKMGPGQENNIEEIQSFAETLGMNVTVNDALLIIQIQKALKGDTQAAQFVRDTNGQKPDDTLNLAPVDTTLEVHIDYGDKSES